MLISFKSKNMYQSLLDKEICNESLEYISKFKDRFNDKSWECKIRTSFNLTNNILNIPEFHKLKMNILSHIDSYMHQSSNFFNGYIKTSWINIYEKDFYQEYHIHNNLLENFISGVIYLSENNSDIILASDGKLNNIIKHKPSYGDILLFSGDTPHRVEPNMNDTLRISLAFNFKLVDIWNRP